MGELPVVVIGGGPVGLAAAARLVEEGMPFRVLEKGEAAGAAVSDWGHVRLFSPWKYLVDDAARRLLASEGWPSPKGEEVPRGRDLVAEYLEPLSRHPAIAPHLETAHRVLSVSRSGIDKLSSVDRDRRPFELRVETPEGEKTYLARAVIDASGTYDRPNPIGSNGLPAIGERLFADRIEYGLPDVSTRRSFFAGKSIGVVGSGHSAFNVLLDLAEVVHSDGGRVHWFIRAPGTEDLFGGEDADGLSERGALGRRMRELAESGVLSIHCGFRTRGIRAVGGRLVLESAADESSDPLDRVIAVTGFRPDLSMSSELRVALDPAVEAPVALAPLIDPNVHSCGTVPPHGYLELRHPEQDFYIVGMKSYGRAPTFLMMTGYEQVRSVVKALAGDLDAAGRVELELPETGVCSAPLEQLESTADAPTSPGSCCGESRPEAISTPLGSG